VGNVGPYLAICNGGGKDGFCPLDVIPAPCLDVTPSCHIKGWKCVRADAAMRPCGDGRVQVDAPMSIDFFSFKKKLSLKKKKNTLEHGTTLTNCMEK
jgi:hypothetical protein